MEFITKIFDLNLENLVPELDSVLGLVQFALKAAVLIGPAILLILGLIYLLRPPKEANHRFGFRTYFGMGSVEAWRFTQRLAGLAFTALGGILLIIMFIVVLSFGKDDYMAMARAAMTSLLWQAGLIILVWLALNIIAAVTFDKDGNRRR